MNYQDKSQLGLHFDPDSKGAGGYKMTHTYWDSYRDAFLKGDTSVQLVIEAGYHTIMECEHNTVNTAQGWLELEMLILGVREMIDLVLRKYES